MLFVNIRILTIPFTNGIPLSKSSFAKRSSLKEASMKLLVLINVIALSFVGFSAQAFISSEEQTQLLSSMNKLNNEVHFQDVRCSARSRMCLVRLELGEQKLPVGCSIERINSPEDLFKETANGLQLSAYSEASLNECIARFVR
jgi:hypothetical protein